MHPIPVHIVHYLESCAKGLSPNFDHHHNTQEDLCNPNILDTCLTVQNETIGQRKVMLTSQRTPSQ